MARVEKGKVRQMPDRKSMRIAVDFDGTLATRGWPEINDGTRWNDRLARWLTKRRAMGDTVVLWTCRENYGGIKYEDRPYLNSAVQFCTRHQMFFDSVNRNVGEAYGEYQLNSMRFGRKVVADLYIDDRSLPFDPEGRLAGLWWRLYLFLIDRKLARMAKK